MITDEGVRRSLVLSLIAASFAVYAVTAVITDARVMLKIFNPIMATISVAVAVSYSSAAWVAATAPRIQRTHMLAMGIFLSWASSAMLRLLSAAVYGLDNPSLQGTDYSTFALYLQAVAGVFHIIAPSTPSRTAQPSKTIVFIGLWAGAGVALMLLLLLLR